MLRYDISKVKSVGLFNNMHPILDRGHGENTPGKRSPDSYGDGDYYADIKENHINECITRKVSLLLEMCGADYTILAPDWFDEGLNHRCAMENKIATNKRLKERIRTVLISIHNNAHKTGQWTNARGTETYHFPSSYYGKTLANILHMYIRLETEDDLPDRGVKQADFQMLRATKSTATLLELAFMTNKLDCKLLQDDKFLNKLSVGITNGIIAWAIYWKLVDDNLEQDITINPEYFENYLETLYLKAIKA